MRKPLLFLLFIFLTCLANAQWNQVPLNYKHIKRPDFFIPLAIHFSDTSTGFILNSNSLMKFNNRQWEPVNTGIPDSFSYINLFTVNAQNVFLCGWDGKVSKFNGDSAEVLFTLDPSEAVNTKLNSIFMIDSTRGWAGGDGGTVVKIDGTTHTMQNLPEQYSVRDIYLDNPDHGWMIAYQEENLEEGGVILELVDGTWVFHSAVPGQAFDIEFSPGGTGFITGQLDIYRFDPSANEWLAENIDGYYEQHHLSMLDDNYGISVSDNNQNLVYHNGVWSPAPAAAVADFASIKTTGYGKAWAISQTGSNNPNNLNEGKIQELENDTWSAHSLGYLDTLQVLPLDVAITNITGTDKKNVWFDGQYLNLPADKNWPDSTPALNSDSFCNSVKILSANFGMGLNGDLLEWNGSSWLNKNIDAVLSPDTSINNTCMQAFADTTAFICRQLFAWSSGEIRNVIAKYDYQSNSLTSAEQLDTRSPFAIHFSDKQNGWVVGDSGLLVKYSGEHWGILPAVTDKRLNCVFTIDANTAWAAGDGGTLLKYDGLSWRVQPLPTEQNLRSIYFVNHNNGWVVGDSGLIFYYDGQEWKQDITHNTVALYSIFMIDSTYGFAGGENGTLLQYTKPPPPPPPVQMFCEHGSTWYAFHLAETGYTYQWQADSGNGFENIQDDAVYSGTGSDTLWLMNMPSSFYGYHFRCVATKDAIDSISTTENLRFVNTWTGAVSTAWEDPGNWSCGSLPGENTDVLIKSGEVILSTQASIRSLAVLPAVNITLAENATLHVLK